MQINILTILKYKGVIEKNSMTICVKKIIHAHARSPSLITKIHFTIIIFGLIIDMNNRYAREYYYLNNNIMIKSCGGSPSCHDDETLGVPGARGPRQTETGAGGAH